MTNKEALIRVREALRDVPPEHFGSRDFFTGQEPCCAIGHAIDRIPGAKDRFFARRPFSLFDAAAEALGMDSGLVDAVVDMNDAAEDRDRKVKVMEHLDYLIAWDGWNESP